jgi:hypothetical protein
MGTSEMREVGSLLWHDYFQLAENGSVYWVVAQVHPGTTEAQAVCLHGDDEESLTLPPKRMVIPVTRSVARAHRDSPTPACKWLYAEVL